MAQTWQPLDPTIVPDLNLPMTSIQLLSRRALCLLNFIFMKFESLRVYDFKYYISLDITFGMLWFFDIAWFYDP